jgi:hypothetical protein
MLLQSVVGAAPYEQRCFYHQPPVLLPSTTDAATTGRQRCYHRPPNHRPPALRQSATSVAAIWRRCCSNRPSVLLPAGGVFLPWVIGGATMDNEDATMDNEDATMSHPICYHRPPDLLASWAFGCATMSGWR